MLTATPEETERVTGYMREQAPELTVEFVQKVYSENVLHVQHDIWDVHTNVDRWWVITMPMNLYSQEQFPNMDIALSFHVGLGIRIPRSDRQKLPEIPLEPFVECMRGLQETSEALEHAQEVADFQSIGVRCREALLSFVKIAQTVMPWAGPGEPPKKADLKAWVDHICSVALAGDKHKERRQLFKSLLENAWQFANWLTHTKSSSWYDAETALTVTDNAIFLCMSDIIRHIRGVPESCPACGSQRLSPERAFNPDFPEEEWERPSCTKCGWKGKPVQIHALPEPPDDEPPSGEHFILPKIPLRQHKRPSRKAR